MNVKTLCVGLTKNKRMVGEYEDVSKKHAEGADRSTNPRVKTICLLKHIFFSWKSSEFSQIRQNDNK